MFIDLNYVMEDIEDLNFAEFEPQYHSHQTSYQMPASDLKSIIMPELFESHYP